MQGGMRPPPFGGPPPSQQHHYMGRPPPSSSGPPPISPTTASPINPAEAANDKLNTLFVGAIAAGVDDGWIQKLLEVKRFYTFFTLTPSYSLFNRLVVN